MVFFTCEIDIFYHFPVLIGTCYMRFAGSFRIRIPVISAFSGQSQPLYQIIAAGTDNPPEYVLASTRSTVLIHLIKSSVPLSTYVLRPAIMHIYDQVRVAALCPNSRISIPSVPFCRLLCELMDGNHRKEKPYVSKMLNRGIGSESTESHSRFAETDAGNSL